METDDRPSTPPTRCPYGHPLATGLVQLSWQPCQCPAALAHYRGHTTYTCRICSDQGWTMVYFEPEHIRSADEVDAEQEGAGRALAELGRAEAAPEELTRYRHALASRERMAAARRSRSSTTWPRS